MSIAAAAQQSKRRLRICGGAAALAARHFTAADEECSLRRGRAEHPRNQTSAPGVGTSRSMTKSDFRIFFFWAMRWPKYDFGIFFFFHSSLPRKGGG